MPKLSLTTNPGIEDVVVDELAERLAAAGLDANRLDSAIDPVGGRVHVDHPGAADSLVAVCRKLRSIHHVIEPLAAIELPVTAPAEALEATLQELDIPALAEGQSFRVTCNRHGQHELTSQDFERRAGAVLVHRYGAPVDLTGYRVEVRIDIKNERANIGLQLTNTPLSQRHRRLYQPSVALRANLAYAAMRLARLGPETQRLADPFCGSGTVLLEAAQVLPSAELWGSDWNRRAVHGAQRNIEAAGLGERARVLYADARHFADHYPHGAFDALVTNPPYGRQIGRGMNFADFYCRVLQQARQILAPGARAALFIAKRGSFNFAVRRTGGMFVRHVRVVQMNKVFPAIFIVERTHH